MTVAIQVSGRTSCLTSSPLVLITMKYSINQFELLEVVDEPCVEWISFKLFFRWLSMFLYPIPGMSILSYNCHSSV
jgi:hypothetical protein